MNSEFHLHADAFRDRNMNRIGENRKRVMKGTGAKPV
jgi:hypothetical protein